MKNLNLTGFTDFKFYLYFRRYLWHINFYGLFNAKSSLHIYICVCVICKLIVTLFFNELLELIICTQLDSFKYCYLTSVILFIKCSNQIQVLYKCGRIFSTLSFFVGYILSFGLVRLRTIRLSARVGAHIERMCSRSRGEDVTITYVIIKSPDRK